MNDSVVWGLVLVMTRVNMGYHVGCPNGNQLCSYWRNYYKVQP